MESVDNGTRRDHAAAALLEDNVESGGLLYITSTGRNDVLMGRGAPMIQYEGNVRFRDLVSTRKEEYMGTGRHLAKCKIADQVVDEIHRRRGRFLRKVATKAEAAALGVPKGTKAWVLADRCVVLEKVKQALRDKDPVKKSGDADDAPDAEAYAIQPNTAQPTLSETMSYLSRPQNGGFAPMRQNDALSLYQNDINSLHAPVPVAQQASHIDKGYADLLQRLQAQENERQLALRSASTLLARSNSNPFANDRASRGMPAGAVGPFLQAGTVAAAWSNLQLLRDQEEALRLSLMASMHRHVPLPNPQLGLLQHQLSPNGALGLPSSQDASRQLLEQMRRQLGLHNQVPHMVQEAVGSTSSTITSAPFVSAAARMPPTIAANLNSATVNDARELGYGQTPAIKRRNEEGSTANVSENTSRGGLPSSPTSSSVKSSEESDDRKPSARPRKRQMDSARDTAL